MDLLPLLQTALVIFGTSTVLFLFVSFFIYKMKHRPNSFVSQQHQTLSSQRAPQYETHHDIVHTIAIPESGIIAHGYDEAPQPAYIPVYQPQEQFRKSKYEVMNNTAEYHKKVRINPYTMFR